jgi:hypothetical protein
VAQEITDARILDFADHCRRRVELHVEDQELPFDFDDSARRGARVAADATEAVLYEHIERALELWQREGGS